MCVKVRIHEMAVRGRCTRQTILIMLKLERVPFSCRGLQCSERRLAREQLAFSEYTELSISDAEVLEAVGL